MRIISILLGSILVIIVAGLLFIYSGSYNIAATEEHTGVVEWALKTTQERSIQTHAGDEELALASDSAALRAGALAYDQMCLVCHGAPGQDRGWMGQGLNPEPPDLTRSVNGLTAQEVHWVLRHGIKLAGMPALSPTHSDDEILELTSFVMQLPDMAPADYEAWSERDGTNGNAAPPGHEGHDHAH